LAGTRVRRLAHHALQNRLEPSAVFRRLQEKQGRQQFQHAAARGPRHSEIATDHRRERLFAASVTNEAKTPSQSIDVENR